MHSSDSRPLYQRSRPQVVWKDVDQSDPRSYGRWRSEPAAGWALLCGLSQVIVLMHVCAKIKNSMRMLFWRAIKVRLHRKADSTSFPVFLAFYDVTSLQAWWKNSRLVPSLLCSITKRTDLGTRLKQNNFMRILILVPGLLWRVLMWRRPPRLMGNFVVRFQSSSAHPHIELVWGRRWSRLRELAERCELKNCFNSSLSGEYGVAEISIVITM